MKKNIGATISLKDAGFKTGIILGGGEAGDEAVLPLNTFWNKLNKYISNASDKKEASIQMNLNFYGDNKDMNSLADEVVNTVVPKLKLALQNI